jgi:hypothetical protein
MTRRERRGAFTFQCIVALGALEDFGLVSILRKRVASLLTSSSSPRRAHADRALSAVAADLQLLIQFQVRGASHDAIFIAQYVGRQIAGSRLAMADGCFAGIRGVSRRIGLHGRRRALGRGSSALGECHAQENGAKHRHPRDDPRSETANSLIGKSRFHLRLLN